MWFQYESNFSTYFISIDEFVFENVHTTISQICAYVQLVNVTQCLCLFCRVDEDEEIIVKAMTDYWVVGKKSDQRELYVILNQKNANLIEVNGMLILLTKQWSDIMVWDCLKSTS